jgi:beta-phosphoglucomutase family hydrolase
LENKLRIIVPPEIRGLIFDCDGTIADTMPLHYRAWVAALGEHGCEFPEALFYEWAGMPTEKIIEQLNGRHGHSMPVTATARRKEQLFEELIPDGVIAVEPVVQVIREYADHLPMAVATGGTYAICTKTLTALGLAHMFAAIVTADDVEHGKPAPDIFMEAARRIKIPPERCMAFEDGDLGIRAAEDAGMLVCDIRKLASSPQSL